MDPAEEHRILEEALKKALEEASTKTTNALDLEGKPVKEQEKTVWYAMESVEFTSFVFAMTHDFEDIDPQTPQTKGMNVTSLVKEATEAVQQVRSSKGENKLADYTRLRDAVHYLRVAYLQFVRKPKRTGQNLTRS